MLGFGSERRLGELIKAQKATVGLNEGAKSHGPGRGNKKAVVNNDRLLDERPTLKDAGISKDLSSRSQKLAAIPESEFAAEMGNWREAVKRENERVVTNLLKIGNRRERGQL